MLTDICRLFDRDIRVTLDEKPIKVFVQQCLNCFREIADDTGLDMVGPVQNGECAVLEDRVGIEC